MKIMPCKEKPMKISRMYMMNLDTGNVISDDCIGTVTLGPIVYTIEVPKIIDVKVINDKVVIVTFIDGTQTKAVCDKDDTFNLEVGIGICITKRLMSNDEQTGNSMFNKSIKDALKVMKRNEQLEQARKEFEEEKKRIEAKIQRKKEKRAEKRRQKKIQMMADAILLADKMKTENN
jgi:hypothetical protein